MCAAYESEPSRMKPGVLMDTMFVPSNVRPLLARLFVFLRNKSADAQLPVSPEARLVGCCGRVRAPSRAIVTTPSQLVRASSVRRGLAHLHSVLVAPALADGRQLHSTVKHTGALRATATRVPAA